MKPFEIKMFTNDIEQISVQKLVFGHERTDYTIDNDEYFYIGDKSDIVTIDGEDFINLKRMEKKPFIEFNLQLPELDENKPYEFSPYQEILGKYNIFNSILVFVSIEGNNGLGLFKKIKTIFKSKYSNTIDLWNKESKEWFLQLNLKNYKLDFEKKIIKNIPVDLPEDIKLNINEFIQVYDSGRSHERTDPDDDPDIIKMHLMIKPLYIIYVAEMIYKHFEKFCLPIIYFNSKAKEIEKSNNINLPDTPFRTYFSEYKITKNSAYSIIHNLYKKKSGGFLPTFAFYIDYYNYTDIGPSKQFSVKHFIKTVNEIFPKNVQELISNDLIARFNIKINKMINIGFGNGDEKAHVPPESKYGVPIEYIKILETCNQSLNKSSCLKKNELSNYFTGTNICIYDENKNECIGTENLKENNVLPGFDIKTIDDFHQWLNDSRYCKFMKGDSVMETNDKERKVGYVIDIYDYFKYGCNLVKVHFLEKSKYKGKIKTIIHPEMTKVIESVKLDLVKKYDPLRPLNYYEKYLKYKQKYLNLKKNSI